MKSLGVIMLSAMLVTACASPVPKPIRNAPPTSPSVSEVRGKIAGFKGTEVRWGGTVAGVNNLESATMVEVVGRKLADNGRPQEDDNSEGRFLARVKGFLDPAIYSKGREITVIGVIAGKTTRPIGEYKYRYPVVNTQSYYLWKPRPKRQVSVGRGFNSPYNSPFFYVPFNDPFSYGGYPYYW